MAQQSEGERTKPQTNLFYRSMDSCPAQKEVKASQLLTKHQSTWMVVASSLEATNFSVLFAWLPPPQSSIQAAASAVEKNGHFQFCVLISVMYPVIVWTQNDSSYLVGIFDAFMNPFSGFFMDKKVWRTLYNTMHGGYSSVKRPNDVFTKEFLWLSLYTK